MRVVSFMILCVFLVCSFAMAGGTWAPVGPPAGTILQLVPDRGDPALWFAVNNGALYRSNNGTKTWNATGLTGVGLQGPAGVSTYPAASSSVTVLPTDSEVLAVSWGGNNQSRLWVSTDHGKTFRVRATLPFLILDIIPDPSNAAILYADTFDGHGPGVSTDGGRNWGFFKLPLPLHSHPNCSAGSIDATNLALSPFHPEQLFVSGTVSFICGPESDSEEFFLTSSNSGKSWTFLEEAVYKFYSDQAFPDRVFATGAGGLKTLTRNGWQLVSSIQEVQQVISVPAHPEELFAFQFDLTSQRLRIIRSQDLGESWKELPIDQGGQIKVLAAMDDHSRGLLGGTAGAGLFRRDVTQGWRVDNQGFLESVTNRIVSGSAQILFALSTGLNGHGDAFLYRTTDGGQNWRFVNTQAVGSVSDFALDPNDSNHILVSANGIFFSRDGGSKWQRSTVNQNPCCIGISALAFDPAHSNIAYMAGSNSSFTYRSTDGGATFTKFSPHLPSLGFEDVTRIIVDRNESNVVYFVVPFFGFFKSTDGGQSVRAVNSGIAPPCPGCNSSPGIDLTPLAPRGAYLAITFQGKIYRTQNGGDSWSETGKTPFTQNVSRIFSADGLGQHLYAIAGFYPHLYESLNSGKSWTDVTSQFGANAVVYDLTDPHNLPLFAGTNHGAFIRVETAQPVR